MSKSLVRYTYRTSHDQALKGKYLMIYEGKCFELVDDLNAAVELSQELAINDINECVEELSTTCRIPEEFITEQLRFESTPLSDIVELYFAQNRFDIAKLTPLMGCIEDFHDELKKLRRPYIALSEADYQALLALGCDTFINENGVKFTFGNASVCGSTTQYALMPYNSESERRFFQVVNEA